MGNAFTFRLTPELEKKLDHLSYVHNIPKSEVISNAIDRLLISEQHVQLCIVVNDNTRAFIFDAMAEISERKTLSCTPGFDATFLRLFYYGCRRNFIAYLSDYDGFDSIIARLRKYPKEYEQFIVYASNQNTL